MLTKTIAATGIFAAIGGGIITSIPASAQVPAKDGHTNQDSSSHSRSTTFRHYHRNRNSNWSSEDALNRIRLPFNSHQHRHPHPHRQHQSGANTVGTPGPSA
jgi:hypothetical protein